jgi:RecB family exonuclease
MILSPSKITLYSDCGLKYKFQYIDGIKKLKTSIHLIYGSSIHKALELLNNSLIQKDKTDIEDVLQAFDDHWKKETTEGEIKNGFYEEKLYYTALETLIKFYKEYSDYEVLASETEFSVPFGDTQLHGIIDAVIQCKGKIYIVDYKTSKDLYEKFKIDTSIQLAIYAYAFRHLLSDGKFPNIVKTQEDYVTYYVLTKDIDNLQIEIQKKKITEKEIKRLEYIANQATIGIQNKIFLPNYNSQCKYCEYKKECLNFEG